jgi:putative ATPase
MKPPLAEELRPQTLDDVVGQTETLTFLRGIIETGYPLSIILWGPPGCGKTTIARLYADAFGARFVKLSAVLSGVADLKRVITEAENRPLTPTILFVDEIHRFNKAQQDAFLPHVEKGTLTLVGATTENPSFSLNNALLSRARVLALEPLSDDALTTLLTRYEEKFGPLEHEQADLISMAQGDGRYLYNLIESGTLHRRSALYDRAGDGHYNLISALHKSVRGSDPDAALYWLARMLEGGEEPLYLFRRLIRMAIEDIGLADPEALKQAIAGRDAFQMLGSPEGDLALAQVTLYLALAPKSNALYTAFKAARKKAASTGHLSPPGHILSTPTQPYIYDHDTPDGFSGQHYFPDDIARERFYTPVSRGFEREMEKRLAYFASMRQIRN